MQTYTCVSWAGGGREGGRNKLFMYGLKAARSFIMFRDVQGGCRHSFLYLGEGYVLSPG